MPSNETLDDRIIVNQKLSGHIQLGLKLSYLLIDVVPLGRQQHRGEGELEFVKKFSALGVGPRLPTLLQGLVLGQNL